MTLYGDVVEVERLTPHMVRVVLGGEGLAGFTLTPFTDQYVNALFLPPGAPYNVPFDPDEARALGPEHRPRGRRYTVRGWDPASRQVTIDFVVHGDVGFAGRWASRATPGDRLQIVWNLDRQFAAPSGRHDYTAAWLLGDEFQQAPVCLGDQLRIRLYGDLTVPERDALPRLRGPFHWIDVGQVRARARRHRIEVPGDTHGW